jgi:hypothetical protein
MSPRFSSSRVLVNILDNAAKYSPPGGRIEIRAAPDGERVSVRVSDDDPGVVSRRAGAVTTIGIPVGILIIVAAFVLTGIYVRRANAEFDALNQQIVEGSQW